LGVSAVIAGAAAAAVSSAAALAPLPSAAHLPPGGLTYPGPMHWPGSAGYYHPAFRVPYASIPFTGMPPPPPPQSLLGYMGMGVPSMVPAHAWWVPYGHDVAPASSVTVGGVAPAQPQRQAAAQAPAPALAPAAAFMLAAHSPTQSTALPTASLHAAAAGASPTCATAVAAALTPDQGSRVSRTSLTQQPLPPHHHHHHHQQQQQRAAGSADAAAAAGCASAATFDGVFFD
jgi:hypothetical protein